MDYMYRYSAISFAEKTIVSLFICHLHIYLFIDFVSIAVYFHERIHSCTNYNALLCILNDLHNTH